ncbi:MAG: hypothetical protein KC561_12985, partial [Myxococcales bacterium]|nr:hypothetical protein [Myxococcales bacterium]
MTFEWLIAMRYLRSRRRRMVSLITMISVAGVALGVFLLIVVLSVMGGFAADIKSKILDTKAHVVVGADRGTLERSPEIVEYLRSTEGIVGASAYVESEVMLSSASHVEGIVLRGIDPSTVGETSVLPDSMEEGHLEWLTDPAAATEDPLDRDLDAAGLGGRLPRRGGDDGGWRDVQVGSSAPSGPLGDANPTPIQAPNQAVEGTGQFVMPTIPGTRPREGTGSSATVMQPIPGTRPRPESDGYDGLNELLDSELAPPSLLDPSGMRPIRSGSERQLPGILLGTELAKRLAVGIGDVATIISPDGQLLPTGPAPLSRPFVIVGIFYTGFYEFDTR